MQALRGQKTRGLPLVLFEPACEIYGLGSLPLRLRGRPTFRDIACARLANQVNMKQGEGGGEEGSSSSVYTSGRGHSSAGKVPKDNPAKPHEAYHAIRVACLCFCMPLRLRGKPRCFRGVSCAWLVSTTAPSSRFGNQGWLVTQTSLSVSKWPSRLGRVTRLRTRPSSRPSGLPSAPPASLEFRAKKLTAHASTLGTRAAVNSLPCVGSTPEGLRPFGRGFVSKELDLSDRRVDCDAATRVLNASCHLAVVASDVLLDSELSEQSSSIRAWPSLSRCSPFERTSNHHSSDSLAML